MVDEFLHYNLCPATSEEAEVINEKLGAFNGRQLSFHGHIEELKNYVIKDGESIIAGINTSIYFRECMFINIPFVDEQYRGKGLGNWLLQYAEDKAKSLGVKLVHLDTFDFQAKDFYLKRELQN